MNFNQSEFENDFTTTKHGRSGSEIIFEGSTLAQYLQEQEEEFNEGSSELKSFSEQTLTSDYFPSLKTEVTEKEEKSSEFSGEGVNNTDLHNFSSSKLISNLYTNLKSTNFTKALKDLITASPQINTEFYNLIDDCIEKIEFFGWLNSSTNNWKLNSNLVNFENNLVNRPKTLNLLPMAHRYYLSAAFTLVIALLFKFGLSSYFLNYSILFIIGALIIRFYNLNLWYSNLTGFCQNLNQFLQIYLELDKDFKQIIHCASEIELVSKGFRSGIKHDYSSSSIDEESRELLMDSIQKLKDSYLSCQFQLIKEFDLPYTREELENLQNLPALEEEFTWLSRIKLEYEKLFIARKTLLNLIFNLVKFNLVDLEGFLRFFNNNFNQLSLTGNGIKIQLKEVFNINSNSSSPNTSILSHSFDSSLLRHHRKKSSLHSTCSTPDEDQMNAQIKLNKSLNSLELEMRTWFAKFHVINSSISNISQSTTLKNDPEEIQKAIDSVINEFKQMTQSVTILSESSKRSEQLLKDWSESFNTNHSILSPSLTLIEEEELNTSPNVNDILVLNETPEVFDCEADQINGNLENLLTAEPECFEIEAQPLPLEPELVKSKLTREERIKQIREKRNSENRQTMSRPNVTLMVQELNSAIKSHQLKMESIRIKPQRPRSMPPSRGNNSEVVDNTDDNLRPNTPVNFEAGDSNSNFKPIVV